MLRFRNYLYRKKLYWLVKNWLLTKPIFRLWKKFFSIKTKFSDSIQIYGATKESLPTVAKFFILSISFILITEISPAIIHYLLSLFGEIFRIFSPFVSLQIFAINKISLSLDTDFYKELLTTIAAASGVFLGLYFTAISVVAGSLFPKLTESVRELFIKERVGAQYVKIISFSMLVSVGYLLLLSLGYHPHSLGAILIAVVAIYGIGTFVFLGFRAFYFFDPTILCPIPLHEVYKNINYATVDGFRFKDQNFSYHYQKQASRALNILKELTDYAIDNNNKNSFGNQLVILTANFGYLLKKYLNTKKRIPTNSLWYKNKPQYPSWLLTDSMEISMALNTGTSLSPKYTREKDWFEKECITLSAQPLESLILVQNWSAVQSIIEKGFVDLGEDVGNQLDTNCAQLMLNKLDELLRQAYLNDKFKSDDGIVAVVDSHGRYAIALLLGLMKYVSNRTPEDLMDDYKSINWRKHDGIYKTNLPHPILEELEDISKSLNQEILIEGKIVSPDWYLQTLYVRKHLELIKEYFEFLCKLNDNFYLKNIECLQNKKRNVLLAQFMLRWLEYLNKMEWLLKELKSYTEGCKKFHKVKDLPWPEINIDDTQKKLSEWHKNAMVNMAGLLPSLSQVNRTNDQPDYFGQAYTLAVEDCYVACASNEFQHFQKIFPLVFLACLSAYDITRKEVVGWNNESQILFSSEPIIDLLELSGYAIIYSELYENNDMINLCQQYWDKYLSNNNAPSFINLVVSLVNYRDSVFKIMPKAYLRANWDIRLKQILIERNLILDSFGERFQKKGTAIIHKSSLIRIISYQGTLLPASAIEVFFAVYLSKHKMASGIQFPDRHGIEKKINEESKKNHAE